MAFKLAEAFVQLFVKDGQMNKDLDATKGKLNGIVGSLAQGVAGLEIGRRITQFLSDASSAASAAEEVRNKFEAVFKDLTPEADKFVSTFARATGRGIGELENRMASFQNILKGFGFSNEDALPLAKQLTELNTDLASFHNEADQVSAVKLLSGLASETEAVRRYGADVRVAALNTEFLRMGLNVTNQTATEQQRVMARLNIIMRSTADAHGDATRTAGSFENRMKKLQGAMTAYKAAVGAAINRAVGPLISMFADMANLWVRMDRAMNGLLGTWVATSFAIAGVTTAVFTLRAALLLLGQQVVVMTGGVALLIFGIGAAIAIAVTAVRSLIQWLFSFPAVQKLWNAVTEEFGRIWQEVQSIFMSAMQVFVILGQTIVDIVNSLFGTSFENILGLATAMVRVFGGIVVTILGFVANLVQFWVGAFAKMMEVVKILAPIVLRLLAPVIALFNFLFGDILGEFLKQVGNLDTQTGTSKDAPGGKAGAAFGIKDRDMKQGRVGFTSLVQNAQKAAFSRDDPAKRTADATAETAKHSKKAADLLETMAVDKGFGVAKT